MTDLARLPTIKPRVAIYARFSSNLQRDASIEDQIRVCAARADREGWEVTETFTDFATSGATTLRPGYQAVLTALRTGKIDIVLAESLDRFSRDLEHIASFYKQCSFHHVRIHTVGEGEVSELHIGLKGTMGALYLKDLADKTKRGLEGRIHAGRAAGPPPFGYSVVRTLKDDGEIDRGLRAIDPDRAAIVRRVFEAYASGSSPRRIARSLNAEGVMGPGGGAWYDSSILGRATRCDGILRNELYVGRLVWRRRFNTKNPVSGKTMRRDSHADTLITTHVPQLRIVDDVLWQRVQDRLGLETAPLRQTAEGNQHAFWEQRRPRHLLSGKVFCGSCGRQFSTVGKDYLGCRAAIHGTCINRRTVRRGTLENHVLDLLARQLMSPTLVEEFVAAFNQEWHRLAREVKAQALGRHKERVALDRKIGNLVDAISDGRSSSAIRAKLTELEGQRAAMGKREDPAALNVPALHPGISKVYASRIKALTAALARGDDPEALESARALIDKVTVYPPETDDDPPGIELEGDLLALLQVAGLAGTPASRGSTADPVLALFVGSVKAGSGTCPQRGRGAEPPPSFSFPDP